MHDSATGSLSGVIICPAKGTAVMRRTPSPSLILRRGKKKSTLLDPSLFHFRTLRNGQDGAIRIFRRRDAAGPQCGGKSERKKIDFGTERIDKWGSGASETAKPSRPTRVRSRCAANPCCRTIRNAHSRYIRRERPRRKTASHTHGNAKDATLPFP